jgi:septum formation protein
MKGRPLILASQSPQRLKLLKQLRIPFQVIPSHVNENCREKNPKSLVLKLAMRKAMHVAKKHAEAWVLGADTIVTCQGQKLFKPRSPSHARRMLSLLNGHWHRVYTGVALVDAKSGAFWKAAAVTKVKARKLSPEALERLSGKHMDKAGGYAVQDRKDPFIEKVVGARDNVIGLPLATVRNLLSRASRRLP